MSTASRTSTAPPPPHNVDVTTARNPTFLAALKQEWPSLLRHGLQVLVFNTGVAALQIVMGHDGRWDTQLVYAQAIGLSIWAWIDFGRLFLSRADDAGWPKGWRGIALTASGIGVGFLVGVSIGDLYSGSSTLSGVSLMSGKTRRLLGSVGVTVIAGSIGTSYFYARSKAQFLRAQAAATERDLAETRLKLLESQLEPHMLFNTLANLRVLIALDPERAQAMLDRLIAFLRATLSASRSTTHPLREEFARVDDYLSLMEVRMGDRLVARLSLPDDLADVAVPSLLLQPLVENAIKHGLEPNVDGGRVEVSAARVGGDLVLTVRDSGTGMADSAFGAKTGEPGVDASTAGSHFGLVQVRQRLNTLYGDAARLELKDPTVASGPETGPRPVAPDAVDALRPPPSGTVAVVTIALEAIGRATAAMVDRSLHQDRAAMPAVRPSPLA